MCHSFLNWVLFLRHITNDTIEHSELVEYIIVQIHLCKILSIKCLRFLMVLMSKISKLSTHDLV